MTIQEFQSELFGLLEDRLAELQFETESVADNEAAGGKQIGSTLMFLLPVTEDDDRVLTDLRLAAIDDERFYVQIYLTIFTQLEQEGYRELEKAISALNYSSRLGAYGMLPVRQEFFCKYNFLVRDFDLEDGPQGFAAALLDALDVLREQQTLIYGIAAALASGSLTFEQAIEAGL